MKRENRVLKHIDFDRIIKNGKAIKSNRFSIHYERNDLDKTHVGIAVSKRNGGAVTRVKIKRQIRYMFGKLWKDLSLPFDIIIIVRTSYKCDEFNDCYRELETSLNQIK